MKTAITPLLFAICALGCGGSSVREQANGGTAGTNGNGGATGSGATAGSSGADGASGSSGASGAGSGGVSGNGSGGVSGAGSGGVSGAGSGGVSGTGSGGVSGTSGASGQCQEPGQCRLFSDCCTCVALGPNDRDPSSCFADCAQDLCSTLGVTSANLMCRGGQCVAGFNCAGTVTCRSTPPACEAGQVPSIVGSCWGPCVPAAQCASVRDCAACTPGQVCAGYETFGGTGNSCVAIPERCRSNPTCVCLGESVCPSHTTCVDRSGLPGVACTCLTC